MKFEPTYKSIWGISFPIIIAGISETVVELTDTIFLAHYGMTELAAVGLAGSIFGVALFLCLGLVDGIQIVISRRVGEDRPLQTGRVFNQGLYLLTLVSLMMILLIIIVVPLITQDLLASDRIHQQVNSYLQIGAYALLFQSVNLAYSAFYVGISRTRVLIGATVTLAATNIALDYALIFGNLGFPELGIQGAALASLIAEIAAFTYLTADIIMRGYHRSHSMLRIQRWNNPLATQLIQLSTPISLEALVEMTKWFVFFIIIEQLGERELAMATIIYSCYIVLLIPVDSFSESSCSMASNLIGQHQLLQLNRLLRNSITLSYLTVLPLLAMTLFFPELILSIFTSDIELLGDSLGSLSVITLALLLAVPAEALYATLTGTGDTRVILLIQLSITIVTLTLAYITAFILELELEYIWLAEVAGWLVCLLLSWSWFHSGRWQRLSI